MPSNLALEAFKRNPCVQCKMPPRITEVTTEDLESGKTHFSVEIRCATHSCGYGAHMNTKKRWYSQEDLFEHTVDRFNIKNKVYT